MNPHRPAMGWKSPIWILAAALVLRLLPLLWMSECFDIALYRYQAIPVFERINPYLYLTDPEFSNVPQPFVYLPLSLFYAPSAMLVSNGLHLPFAIVIRLWAVLFDLGVTALLFASLRNSDPKQAASAAWLYALSPVAVLIASFQGNGMAVPVLLTLLAYAAFDSSRDLSALALGTAIAWRTYPLLLAPVFLMKLRGRREALRYAAWTIVPAAVCAVPFLIADAPALFRSLAYHGMRGSIGWHVWADLRPFENWSWVLFGLAWAAIVYGSGKRPLLPSIAAVLTAYYFLSASCSQQYFLWVLPFLALISLRWAWIYSLLGGAVLLMRYAVLFPEILLGRFHRPGTMLLHAGFWTEKVPVFVLWVFMGILLVILLKRPAENRREEVSIRHAKAFQNLLLGVLGAIVLLEALFVGNLAPWDDWSVERSLDVRTPLSSREDKLAWKKPAPLARLAVEDGAFSWFDPEVRQLIRIDRDGKETARFAFKNPASGEALDVQDLVLQPGSEPHYLVSDIRARFAGRFDAQGRFVGRFFPGEVLAVSQMALSPAGDVAVMDPATPAVWILSASGEIRKRLPFPSSRNPIPIDSFDLAYDPDGRLFLLDGPGNAIISLEESKPLRLTIGHTASCVRLAADGRSFYVLNIDTPKISVYPKEGGRPKTLGNKPGEARRRLDFPCALHTDRDGRLWVADSWKSAILEAHAG